MLGKWRKKGYTCTDKDGVCHNEGEGGVPVVITKPGQLDVIGRKEYYACKRGDDGKLTEEPDWNHRPTWDHFKAAFCRIAVMGGEAHGRSNYAKLQRMRQSKRAELHNRDFLMALGKTPLYNASVDAELVEDFRLIETYIGTLSRKCHPKMKGGKEQDVYSKTIKAYEKGHIKTLQQAFDKSKSVDEYLNAKALAVKPRPLKTYLPAKKSQAAAADSSDEAGVYAVEDDHQERVTMQMVQKVANDAAAEASNSVEKRLDAKLAPLTQDVDTIKVSLTEVALGMKTLLSKPANTSAAAPMQQYQQPYGQAPQQPMQQYQQPYGQQQWNQGKGSQASSGYRPSGKGKGWGGKGRFPRLCYRCKSPDHLVAGCPHADAL